MVTMLSLPVSWCLKTLKSASKSSFALLTVVWKPSQSPAGEMVIALMPFPLRKDVTASDVSVVGAMKASTCAKHR